MATVIITMAGFGRRFHDAGYDVPKYRLQAHGRSTFAWALLSLRGFIDSGAAFVFVVRRADNAVDFIESEAASLGIRSISILALDAPTDGQATTALLAGDAVLRPAEPIIIYNIDTFVRPEALLSEDLRGAGWIPCFPGQGAAWSFARTIEGDRVVEVREKVRVSDHATIGLYYFSSFDLYRELYHAHFRGDQSTEHGERYVAPMYNTLIASGESVHIHRVPAEAVVPFGTPAEYEGFLRADTPQDL